MKEKLTAQKVEAIGEELRITRYKKTGKMAFEYIWEKYKHLFASKFQFLKCMEICAVFFASQGAKTEEIRKNTEYIYI